MNPPHVAQRCRSCGSATLAEPVAGQCPRCLVLMALEDEEVDPSLSLGGSGAGERRLGDYVLERQIGTGGMGVVYAARHRDGGRKVAIKLIRDFHVASPTLLWRFTIEAEAAARLDHPNIVRIHEIGEADGHPFFSMDLIEGEDLNAWIARRKSTRGSIESGPREMARLMAKVARAIAHAHERGVLHRDLKPANILMDEYGEPHLTDFGLAKILQPDPGGSDAPLRTSTAGAPGTPSFMSPEQAAGLPAGVASDVYGLGAVLYALMTGRPPFQGSTPLELFRQIATQPPLPPRLLDPNAPLDLQTICLKCLEKNPRHRYSTAGALAEDLEQFAVGRPISARPAGLVRRTTQWARHNPLGTAFIATLCLGLAAALGLLTVVYDQRREMELDRDQTFDEGMQKVSQLWRDPTTRSVTISARELAILAGRSPAESRDAKHALTLGVSADDGPSSMAQRYARLLGEIQERMQGELGERAVFHLRLFKRFNRNDETLARGDVDLMVLDAVGFLRAEASTPGISAVAVASVTREGVIFARGDSGAQRLADLRGKSLALPDAGLALTLCARARLVEGGLQASDLSAITHIADRDAESGPAVISTTEIVDQVLRGEWQAGVTHRGQFERYRHLGLVLLDRFPEAPNVLAARARLDPRLLRALGSVLRTAANGGAWPGNKFVVVEHGSNSDNASGSNSTLQALRSALAKSDGFDQPFRHDPKAK